VLFLGDYVYESSWGRRLVRRHDAGVPRTLDAYRRRHALYRGDPDLQAAHGGVAWVVDLGRPRSRQRLRGRAVAARRGA
jgi:alkaline phosphatase D